MTALTLAPATLARFNAKIDRQGPADDCWPWLAARQTNGYGSFGYDGRSHLAHRVSFQLAHRLLVPGETVDHLCFNTLCQNPEHLDACSAGENTSRAWRAGAHDEHPSISKYNASKTACKWGHEFDLFNTRWARGVRVCIECKRRRDREYGKQKAAS